MQAEDHADHQPGTDDCQAGEGVVKHSGVVGKAFAAGDFKNDGGQTGQCRNADRDQNDACVFVFPHGDSPHILSVAAQRADENHDQIKPYSRVPASQQALGQCRVRDEPGPGDACGQADQSGKGKARAGAGEVAHAV